MSDNYDFYSLTSGDKVAVQQQTLSTASVMG